MHSQLTLSIGIPAYNEQDNIGNILVSLQKQRQTNFHLDKIYVYLDGSTDDTRSIVTAFSKKFKKVIPIYDQKRRGKPNAINHIFSLAVSDIVVIFDADILIKSKYLLSNLCQPFLTYPNVKLVSGDARPLAPKSFAEKIAYGSFLVWDETKKVTKSKMYYCEGSIRAFAKDLYKLIKFPKQSSADDVFPYLFAKKNHFEFYFQPKSQVFFSLPHTFAQFFSQASRYRKSKSIQEQNFSKNYVKEHYDISLIQRLIGLINSIKQKPMVVFLYLFTYPIPVLLSRLDKNSSSSLWNFITTSKKLSKQKIIISSYDDIKNPYYRGGGATCNHQVAKRIANQFDVTILTSRHSKAGEDGFIDGVYYKRIGFTPHFFPPLGQLIFILLLPFHVVFESYDLWVESFTPPISTAFLPLFTKKPIVALVHLLSGQEMLRKYHLPFDQIERLGVRLYKNFIVLTQITSQKIKSLNPYANIKKIPNGIEIPKIIRTKKDNQVLFIGRIETSQKGLDLLLESYSKMKNPPQTIIAGSGSPIEMARLRSLISQKGLKEKVKIVGHVSGEERDQLFFRSQILVIPSRYETFSLVALESLAYGLPLVSFDIPGMNWFPENGRIKVTPYDTKSFAKAITHLLKNKGLQKEMVVNNRNAATRYSWEKIADLYSKYFKLTIENATTTN